MDSRLDRSQGANSLGTVANPIPAKATTGRPARSIRKKPRPSMWMTRKAFTIVLDATPKETL